MLHRNLCYIHVFLKSLHRKLLTFSTQVHFIQMKPLTKILAHFKGSECEIAFLKFHLLPHLLNVYIFLILNPYTDICVMCSDLQADSPAFGLDYTTQEIVQTISYSISHAGLLAYSLKCYNAHKRPFYKETFFIILGDQEDIFADSLSHSLALLHMKKLRPGWAVVVKWGSGLYLSIINFS